MLAAHQVLGQAGAPTAHDFCTVCDIDKDDIDVVNAQDWTPKNLNHIKYWAERWKTATSQQEREHVFQNYSIRWSPFHRLSYWDSTKYAVIDAMHTLDLGLLQNHVRVLFALSMDSLSSGHGGDDIAIEPKNKLVASGEHLRAYRSCIKAVTDNRATLEADLMKYHWKVLYTFCMENSIHTSSQAEIVTGTAWLLAHSIVRWVRISAHHLSSISLTKNRLADRT
ncbi:hypothetical protein BJ165DRAFT_1355517 [Panaeolus papilionaceus]|nr:hypothetical protein BJ165DRAFT_1355517 [Panaeolus papilionaceus]